MLLNHDEVDIIADSLGMAKAWMLQEDAYKLDTSLWSWQFFIEYVEHTRADVNVLGWNNWRFHFSYAWKRILEGRRFACSAMA